jgi:hypothetical protein
MASWSLPAVLDLLLSGGNLTLIFMAAPNWTTERADAAETPPNRWALTGLGLV